MRTLFRAESSGAIQGVAHILRDNYGILSLRKALSRPFHCFYKSIFYINDFEKHDAHKTRDIET